MTREVQEKYREQVNLNNKVLIVAVNQSYFIKFIPLLLDIGDGVFNNIIELEVILCIIELDLMSAVLVIVE